MSLLQPEKPISQGLASKQTQSYSKLGRLGTRIEVQQKVIEWAFSYATSRRRDLLLYIR